MSTRPYPLPGAGVPYVRARASACAGARILTAGSPTAALSMWKNFLERCVS